MRAIVNVATGPAFIAGQDRLIKALDQIGNKERLIMWRDELPAGSPSHAQVPYGFKIAALREAIARGADTLLWLDSSIIPLRSLEPLWKRIEEQHYWFSRNYDLRTNAFCSDKAAELMCISRCELVRIPHLVAGAFGLQMIKLGFGQMFLARWTQHMNFGVFANGGSGDPEFIAHRHDQTSASVIAWRLGLKCTLPPKWFAEGGQETEETLLAAHRIR